MARAHVMTPARKAALRKAQLASARKRKRGATVRNVGRGVVGSNRGSRKARYRVARAVGYAGTAVAVGGAAAYLAHRNRGKIRVSLGPSKKGVRTKASHDYIHAHMKRMKHMDAQSAFYRRTAPRRASGPANRHNRVFVTSRHGTTTMRKRGH